MNILITGSNGQLGNEMRCISTKSKDHYIFTDIAELDITNLDEIQKILKQEKIDVIVNCAAYTNVDNAEDDRETADKINQKAVRYLAIAAKEADATLIHISTDYVFDGSNNTPYIETDMTSPLGVYGITKLAGEDAIKEIGCKHIIIRTAWLYSQYGKNFVKTILNLTANKDSLKVVFDQVGTPTYAKDLAQGIYHIITNRLLGHQGVYHFSNEGVCSWYDFAIEIRNLSKNDCNIYPCHSIDFPSKVKRPHYSVLDKTLFRETFGFKIPYWKDSLINCIHELINA